MNINFEIAKNIEICKGEQFFDLHNNFELAKICITCDSVLANFRNLEENTEAGKSVQLEFRHPDRFLCSLFGQIKPRFLIDEIGFKNKDDDDLDWLIEFRKRELSDDFVFRFEDNEFIRIHCKDVFANVQ